MRPFEGLTWGFGIINYLNMLVELYVKVHVKILICVSNWVDAIKIKIWIVLMDLCRVFALITSISAWWTDDLFWIKYLFKYPGYLHFLPGHGEESGPAHSYR
jgi:hypothetical protein